MPVISIVIPVYNAERYLDSCLDTVLRQSFKDFELILVDDGSTDGSPAICDNYAEKDNRIKVIHKSNEGVARARKSGLAEANGKYFVSIDSDDSLKDDYLLNLWQNIEKSNADIVICDFDTIVNGKVRSNVLGLPGQTIEADKIGYKNLIEKYVFHNKLSFVVWNKIYRTALIKENFDSFNWDCNMGDDLLFNLFYLSLAKRIVTIKESLYLYWVRDNSMTTKKQTNRLRDMLDIFSSYTRYACSRQTLDLLYVARFLFFMNFFFGAQKAIESGLDKREFCRISQEFLKSTCFKEIFRRSSFLLASYRWTRIQRMNIVSTFKFFLITILIRLGIFGLPYRLLQLKAS